jgi:hypothetical protein
MIKDDKFRQAAIFRSDTRALLLRVKIELSIYTLNNNAIVSDLKMVGSMPKHVVLNVELN